MDTENYKHHWKKSLIKNDKMFFGGIIYKLAQTLF